MHVDTINIDATAALLGFKIKVRGLNGLAFRLTLARALFAFAGRVAGVPVVIDTESARRRVLLDEADRQIDRRVGCVYVSTHTEVDEDGQRWRTWDRIKLPD